MGPLKGFNIKVNRELYTTHSLTVHNPMAASVPAPTADHPFQNWNGCSYVCVTFRPCIEALDCKFRCHSGQCLTLSLRFNNRKDCPDGSDEED
ncbi:hypothetical protein FF38_10207 [Lucilia cuprina]|uniref:Uncharacterized protein n=1 Tax=Lucilia cuprina TaxID=7375 RepID=A0A0L0C5Z1_LUCCU|nr:hypothetical protein FF38_10207 [Lucilia cuprina]